MKWTEIPAQNVNSPTFIRDNSTKVNILSAFYLQRPVKNFPLNRAKRLFKEREKCQQYYFLNVFYAGCASFDGGPQQCAAEVDDEFMATKMTNCSQTCKGPFTPGNRFFFAEVCLHLAKDFSSQSYLNQYQIRFFNFKT